MISRIKNNFTELMESIANKKDEILKQNKIINLESLLSFYKENKEFLLTTINEYISTINLKIDLDLSFIEKLDIACINELIEKVEKFYEDNYIEPLENSIRKKVIEKFKKIVKFSKVLYINFVDTISKYSLKYFSKKSKRAPPVKFLYN